MGSGDTGRAGKKGGLKGRASALWWLGAGFMVIWAFALGIMVGQGYLASPEQLASLPVVGPWFSRPVQTGQAPDLNPRLSYHKELAKRGGASEQKRPAAKKTKPAPMAAAKTKPATLAEKKEPVKKINSKPVAKAPPPEAPRAAPGNETAGKRFAVQVASFKAESEAEEMAARLRKSGLNAYVRQSRVKGVGLRYRVRVGPYESFDQAQGAAGRLRLQLRLAAYVTRE